MDLINPSLITDYESCERRGYYSRDFESNRLHPTEITRRAIYNALSGPREDAGEFAGEEVMRLCSIYDLDLKDTGHLYDVALHHAAIADLVTTWLAGAIGRPWSWPAPTDAWDPQCLLKDGRLLRIALIDHITDERLLSETTSWYTVGSVAAYQMPMRIQFVCLGASKGGRRYSPWSRGFLHPRNRLVRFKPKANRIQGFKETWIQVWREDHDQIARDTWIESMQNDGVIQDFTRVVNVEPFSAEKRDDLLKIINRKADAIEGIKKLPDPSLSACDWPRPCPFRRVCFAPIAVTPGDVGFWSRDENPASMRQA